MGPAELLLNQGYELVFANPQGNEATLDKVSDSDFWYGNTLGATEKAKEVANGEYLRHRKLCESLGICGSAGKLVGKVALQKLSKIRQAGLDQFAAVFFPGGHAPMEDLWRDADVGAVLRYFHKANKPTGLICHAPIALLAALDEPQAYVRAKIQDDRATMYEQSKNWIYRGYAMTVFTTREEQQEEPGQDNALGGYVRFYPDETLEKAGGYVQRADKWQSKVVQDRELITGQNPFSHNAFAEAFVKALEARAQ